MFWRPRIHLTDPARQSIRSVAIDRADRLETGGALFGHDPGAGAPITIVDATAPGPNAVHGASRFQRDLDYTHQRALEIYGHTGAEWIGEWHTHPEGGLKPSAIDLKTYLGHLADPTLGFNRFVAIIVVPTDVRCRAAIWEISLGGVVGRRLRL